MHSRSRYPIFILLSILGILFSACSAKVSPASGGSLKVVATTTIVGDVVKNIGGDHIALTVLIPANVDEHGYEPAPQDIARVSEANLVFLNGAGLEPFIEKLTKNAGGSAKFIAVSDGITLLKSPADAEDHGAGGDPHVWMDPNNVLVWVDNIQKALSAADPQHAADYQKNADQYRQQLRDLDGWVREQVNQVPQERRNLITDHLVFTYFASRYGFDQVGAVVPGYSSLSSPSAQQLAALEDEIRKLNVPVIFVGNTVNPALAERVSQDTNTKLVHILTGSLTDGKGPGATYIDYLRYNVSAMVTALK